MTLQGLLPAPNPNPTLEQYATPASLAADVLYLAHGRGDIEGRRVVDLGCGNGIFALGAMLLGARTATGFESDGGAVAAARENAHHLHLGAEFLQADVATVRGSWDTCIMNPPFGAQRRHADLPFLDAALAISAVTYTLHNAETEPFVADYVQQRGATVGLGQRYKFPIPHRFAFHRKDVKDIEVALLVIEAHDDEGK